MASNKVNVLSLFDGISCGQQALERLGVEVDKYYASEVDKYAISITQKNYPDTVQLGDVTKWREWDIDWASIDLVMGGSPCQGFSMAGKQLAFDDPRSALFFVFVDIRNHIQKFNPNVKFLLENVRMKKDHLDVISQYMGVEPVMINSALVSAQNRVRFYWCNWEITQPEDRGILLKDILETGEVDRDKSLAVTTRVAGATPKRYLEKHQHQMVFVAGIGDKDRAGDGKKLSRNYPQGRRVYSDQGKAATLSAQGVGSIGGHTGIYEITGGAMRGRYNADGKTEQQLEVQNTGKSNSITTVQKDSLVVEHPLPENTIFKKNYAQWDTNNRGNASQDQRAYYSTGKHGTLPANGGESKVKVLKLAGYADIKGHDSIKRVYSDEGKAPTLTTMGGGHREPKVAIKSVGEANARQRRNMKRLDEKGFSLTATAYKGDQSNGMTNITNNLTWRKLTPLECERLQTVADNYTAQGVNDKGETVPISNTQRYRALGNGWTVEVIKHIFGGLYGKQ